MNAIEILAKVLKQPVAYRENGQEKVGTLEELSVRSVVNRALEGNVKSAETLLRLCIEADRYGDPGVEQIYVEDWLPDHPGQTGEQKAMARLQQTDADASEWWSAAAKKA